MMSLEYHKEDQGDDMSEPSKKEVVSQMLKELEKAIHEVVDKGKADNYSPLDLIHAAVQEVVMMSVQQQAMEKLFDENDGDEGSTIN